MKWSRVACASGFRLSSRATNSAISPGVGLKVNEASDVVGGLVHKSELNARSLR